MRNEEGEDGRKGDNEMFDCLADGSVVRWAD